MRKELSITNNENNEKWFSMYVIYGDGVRLPIEDMENLFGGEFLDNVEFLTEDSEPLIVNDDGEDVPVITLVTLIQAVISCENPDMLTLYGLLQKVEDALVNVWD